MKLLSPYRDYYDTVLAHGQDNRVVYQRNRSAEVIALPQDVAPWDATVSTTRAHAVGPRTAFVIDKPNQRSVNPMWSVENSLSDDAWRFDEAFVLIAGKAHPVWLRYRSLTELTGEHPVSDLLADPEQDLERLRALIQERRERHTHLLHRPEVKVEFKEKNQDVQRAYASARERFLQRDFTSLHLDLGAPVLLLASPRTFARQWEKPQAHRAQVVLNPRLLDLNIQRALDPYSVFQSVSQFIEGVVPGQQLPLVEISDRSKVDKKGFDPIYGFRRRPG